MLKYLLFYAGITVFSQSVAWADYDKNEPMLYPAGFPTAEVLRPKEWYFSPQGWSSYGLNAKTTLTVDWLASMFGAPAGYLRHQLTEPGATTLHSLEFYGLYCTKTVTVNRDTAFNQEHKKGQYWLHFSSTTKLNEQSRLHYYLGLTYSEDLRYFSDRLLSFPDVTYKKSFTPDVGLGWEYFVNAWYKFTVYGLYGNTFYYFDQAPQKVMVGGGFQWAPFAVNRHPILARFRFEMNGFWTYLSGPKYTKLVVPFFPVVAWQWTQEF